MTLNLTEIQRFTKFIQLDILTGCWIWRGSIRAGYGLIKFKNQLKQAHRFSYEYYNGKIPEGFEIDHLCRNTNCVNPSHLEAVTHKENCRRGISFQGSKTHCKRNHPYNKINIYHTPDGGRECRICRKISNEKYRRNLS